MKSNGWMKLVLGGLLATIPATVFSDVLRWDGNGPADGLGTTFPSVGTWDNATTATSTNWTTVSSGVLPTIAWRGIDWPTQPDVAIFRTTNESAIVEKGIFTMENPSHIVNVVNTQAVLYLGVANGAYVIMTNGALKVGGIAGVIQVSALAGNGSLLIYSDVQLGPMTNAPTAGSVGYAFEAGRQNNTGGSNGTLIVAGKVYSVITNAMSLSLQPGTPVSTAKSLIVLKAGSEISNGTSGTFSLNVGRGVAGSNEAGRVEFYGTNSYNGATTFYGGTAVTYVDALVSQNGAFGNSSGNLVIGHSTGTPASNKVELLTGVAGVTVARSMNVHPGNTNLNYGIFIGGEHTSGTSTFSGQINLATGSAARDADVNLVSAAGGTVRFTGNIVDGAGGGAPINKLGLGTVELAGANNNYRGGTKVTEGTLLVTGELSGTNTVTVAAGATLGGNGSIRGNTTVNGTLAPGTSAGDLTFNGHLTLGSGSTSAFEINGLLVGQYDRVLLSSLGTQNLTLAGTLDLTVGVFSANPGDIIWLFRNETDGTTSGSFTGLGQDATVGAYNGWDWKISYSANTTGNLLTGGNDVALYAIPEPGTLGILGLGLIATLLRRRVHTARRL
ncbi:MAG: PEP-CTERM sorting domain-containing protein [Kiritimatiellia bacterium]|nr:PEP-CTERM sorting domain-containing protein [Kiritimatiellia bacterium]